MDSKEVSAELRSEVRPLLRERGFHRFTSRYAWRVLDDRVDVINFQSFGDQKARSLGCTSYSFAVNLGCYLRRIDGAPIFPSVALSSGKLPREYECPFRGRLSRTLEQPELSRRDIWYVDPQGRYLGEAAHDVRMVLAHGGLDWFGVFEDESQLLRILQHSDLSESLWGFGARGSPARLLLLEQLGARAARSVPE
jgi:Domain of unknown function (DUF4304)